MFSHVSPNPGEFFDVSSLESSNHKLLRDEFASLELHNFDTLDEFDPNECMTQAEIRLQTSFSEVEEVEPGFANIRREAMLRELGLAFEDVPKDDPRWMARCKYDDGSIDQIRLHERDDGVVVPVHTEVSGDGDGNRIVRISLMSYDKAVELKGRLDDRVERAVLGARLREAAGVDPEVVSSANLETDQLRAMLATLDEIADQDVIVPDCQELDEVRGKLAQAMLPASGSLSRERMDLLKEVMKEYETSLTEMVRRHGFDSTSKQRFFADEQLRRLTALNEQLRLRRRYAKIGLVATYGAVTEMTAGTGMILGNFFSFGEALPTAGGGLLGGVLGIALGVKQMLAHRKEARNVTDFSAEDFYNSGNIKSQLYDEQNAAHDSIYRLNKHVTG